MCGAPLLPYELSPLARDFIDKLTEVHEASGGALDLSLALKRARAFVALAVEFDKIQDQHRAAETNNAILRVTRIVNPVLYTEVGEFEQDPAIQLPMLPGLRRAMNLQQLAAGSRERLFLETGLLRQRNRVQHALRLACEALEQELGRA